MKQPFTDLGKVGGEECYKDGDSEVVLEIQEGDVKETAGYRNLESG